MRWSKKSPSSEYMGLEHFTRLGFNRTGQKFCDFLNGQSVQSPVVSIFTFSN